MVSATPAAWAPPAAKIAPISAYLRTMPVGLVRVEGPTARAPSTDVANLTVPTIPVNVFPITRSLSAINVQKDTVILLCDLNGPGAWDPQAVNSMQFFIRPPATDLATFDSWPISPTPAVTDRAAIYSLVAQNTDVFNTGNPNSGPDLTLDDPSVTGFSVTLSQIYPPGAPAGIPQIFSICRPTGSLLAQYQSSHMPVTIQTGLAGGAAQVQGPQSCAAPYQLTVTVPAGTVYKLDIAPVVTNSACFDPNAFNPAARTFYIEVATALNVPDLNQAAMALNIALSPQLVPLPHSLTPDQLQVTLNLAGLTAGNLAPQIHRVELMIQRWRWQGRPLLRGYDTQGNPVFSFPYSDVQAPGNTPDTVLPPLDGIYFGERDSNDQLVVSGQVDAVTDPAGTPMLYTYDLTQSPQALYYRFAVRVFSRYEGLLVRGTSVESRTLASANAPTQPEQWRRVLPLCRRTVKAPKPAVRLVIPLTRTVNSQMTPGLMVVLNDAWFDWAGLAEQFNVRVVQAIAPDNSVHTEGGPDPIVSNPDYSNVATVTINIERNLTAIGPIGFTSPSDANTNAPLFAKTSFIVPAPRQDNGNNTFTPIDLSWWFLKLQFSRSLDPNGTFQTGPGLDSDWTDPIEAQVLPAANLWYVTSTSGVKSLVDTGTLQAAFGPAISILDLSGNPVTVGPTPFDTPSTNRFEVWALLTIELDDAFGNGGQEAFVDLVPMAAWAAYQPVAGKPSATSLRLVEVQAMSTTLSPPANSWADLAAAMFLPAAAGSVDPTMARARITRVSPPILANA
jgi:hypothetical protein